MRISASTLQHRVLFASILLGASAPLGVALAQPPSTAAINTASAIAETLPGKIMICGGERIYAETLALDRPMRLHVTLVHADMPGDTFMPEWRYLPWREISRRVSADANFRYTFFVLEK